MGSSSSIPLPKHGPLIAQSPVLSGKTAIILRYNPYVVSPSKKNPIGGRGHGIRVGPIENAILWKFEGTSENLIIRKSDDLDLALELNWRKLSIDNTLSIWYSNGHREWACRWCLNANMTISPKKNGTTKKEFVLGIKDKGGELILVSCYDLQRRIVFGGVTAMQKYTIFLEEERKNELLAQEEMKKQVTQICSNKFISGLKADGFVKLPGIVPQHLISNALREVNCQIGKSTTGADQFKGKSFPDHISITNIFNKSMLPFLIQKLLDLSAPFHAEQGQLALRFPGDMCPGDSFECDDIGFENHRKHWHIDGCPSDFLPGSTDHYGRVDNFDVLVGVLLSDIHKKMSGELCVYPGSHYALAKHFKREGLEKLQTVGSSELPTGPKTDTLFKIPPHHCIGKAGDVFIANYMTAHFVAPNTSPYIRYAVYFRVHGPHTQKSNLESMLDPWINWFSTSEQPLPHQLTIEESNLIKGLSSINYVHTTPKSDVKVAMLISTLEGLEISKSVDDVVSALNQNKGDQLAALNSLLE